MGGGRSRPAAVRHVYHPPDTSALDLRHKQAMEAAERERAALTSQLDALTKQVAANAEAQKKKDAEMAALKAVVDKVGRMLCPTLCFDLIQPSLCRVPCIRSTPRRGRKTPSSSGAMTKRRRASRL